MNILNIFLSFFFSSETIMFLHQIFYQGLKARIASWPTLVLGKNFLFYDFDHNVTTMKLVINISVCLGSDLCS